MAKIIEINNQVISIGTDDGKIKEVRASDINFVPHLGDEVEIFETDTKIIVSKVESKNTIPNGGININLANTQTNNTPQPMLVTNKKVVNKIAYCILAFLLGGFGIHKFYAGKTGAGVAYLLFCWTFIPVLLGLIDFLRDFAILYFAFSSDSTT